MVYESSPFGTTYNSVHEKYMYIDNFTNSTNFHSYDKRHKYEKVIKQVIAVYR